MCIQQWPTLICRSVSCQWPWNAVLVNCNTLDVTWDQLPASTLIHTCSCEQSRKYARSLLKVIIAQFPSPLKGEGEVLRSKALVSGGNICLSQHAAGGRHGCGGDAAAAHVVGCPRWQLLQDRLQRFSASALLSSGLASVHSSEAVKLDARRGFSWDDKPVRPWSEHTMLTSRSCAAEHAIAHVPWVGCQPIATRSHCCSSLVYCCDICCTRTTLSCATGNNCKFCGNTSQLKWLCTAACLFIAM